jgi:hypothetical protein
MNLNNAAIDYAGRPIQRLLRNFPWPIKSKILQAPPIEARPGASVLMMLTTRKTWFDALWSAYSWLYFSKADLRLLLFVDGPISQRMRSQLSDLLPGSQLIAAQDYWPKLATAPEVLRNFWSNHTYGRKLGLIYLESKNHSLIFSDPDILLFDFPNDLLECIENYPEMPRYNRELGNYPYLSPRISELMQEFELPQLAGFNSGLMYIPKNGIDEELCRASLATYPAGTGHYFIEQSVFHALLSKAGAQPLDPQNYLLSCDGMYFWQRDVNYNNIIMRHFFGVVRHQMYLKGMPILKKKVFSQTGI